MSDPTPTILIVDDEPYMIRLLQHHVKKAGYDMDTASNGREAWERIDRNPPSLVIMDIMMPEMSGLEVLHKIREKEATRGLPVIIMTANAQKFAKEEAESSGVTVYLTKPFSPTLLVGEIRRQLGDGA